MSKCGKGCMPECEYFTTGGCVAPFNCPYKIETGYINSATSIPTYMGKYNGMSDDDIELCLERFATCKVTDVMNFDYAGTLAYLQRLKAENAALRERLGKAVELPCKVGDTIYEATSVGIYEWEVESVYLRKNIFQANCVNKNDCRMHWNFIKSDYFNEFEGKGRVRVNRLEAEARLAKLRGGK